MKRAQIYFKDWCPYSRRALQLLTDKGVDFEAIDVTNDTACEFEMRERAGRTSVPQIFVGNRHLGGYDDIAALDRRGELDPILAEPSPGRMPGLFLSRVLLAPVARRPPGYYKL